MKRSILTLALLCAAAPVAAQNAPAPYSVAENGRGYGTLQGAVDAIGEGTGTILIAPGIRRDCAVQGAGRITYRAAMPGRAIFDGGICEGKATLVLRGQAASVDGLIFQNLAVPDGNGAGIRLEHGDLSVANSYFRDSEEGILTADDPGAAIRIDKSTFSNLGRCDRDLSCAHSIYVGDYGALTITRSRFQRGSGGHYVKSIARRIAVTDSSFDDTRGRATNYMIDLPKGATGVIEGNVFVQGRDKENYSAFIAVAAEGREHPSTGLAVRNNDARVGPGIDRSSVFLADWSGDRLQLGANRLGPKLKPFERR
ncbi:right-handed parallel beta-helix repeat-containing protein [Novosphingopyxis sp.]|uniref:right-handed parallel beta-helix repeat-containing protein n=1 Tax=Novosphingopyxis sp. TaxID=2709690 RepID=UPI003B5A52DF